MAKKCSMMPHLQPGMPMPEDLKGFGRIPAGTFADFKRGEMAVVEEAAAVSDMTEDELRAALRRQARESRDVQVVIILASAGTSILTTLLAAAGLRGLATTITVAGTAVGALWAISTLESNT